jgi:hypothetical protein
VPPTEFFYAAVIVAHADPPSFAECERSGICTRLAANPQATALRARCAAVAPSADFPSVVARARANGLHLPEVIDVAPRLAECLTAGEPLDIDDAAVLVESLFSALVSAITPLPVTPADCKKSTRPLEHLKRVPCITVVFRGKTFNLTMSQRVRQLPFSFAKTNLVDEIHQAYTSQNVSRPPIAIPDFSKMGDTSCCWTWARIFDVPTLERIDLIANGRVLRQSGTAMHELFPLGPGPITIEERKVAPTFSPPDPHPRPTLPPEQAHLEGIFTLFRLLRERFPILPMENAAFTDQLRPQLSSILDVCARRCFGAYVAFNVPFLLPLELRTLTLHLLCEKWRGIERCFVAGKYTAPGEAHKPKLWVSVNRRKLFDEGRALLRSVGPARVQFMVQFIEEQGAGVGPTRAFFTDMSKEYATFTVSTSGPRLWRPLEEDNALFPSAAADEDMLYEIGILCGMALLMNYELALEFKPAFFAMVLGKEVSPQAVSPQYAASLEDVDGLLGLDFIDPLTQMELVPGGAEISVEEDNVEEYVRLQYSFLCGEEIHQKKISAWIRGFAEVMDPTLLHLFSPMELVELISGGKANWTREDLVANTVLERFEGRPDLQEGFFDVVASLTPGDKALFLQFATGSARLPAGGLANLVPKLTVRLVGDPSHLVSVHTCRKYVKLPPYDSVDVLKEKLVRAFRDSGNYFGFS